MSEKDINPNGSYYCVYDWMTKKAKLKGSKLQVFAVIYGFSQNGKDCFNGSLQYLCQCIGATRPTVIKALKELVNDGYIIKQKVFHGANSYPVYSVSDKFAGYYKSGTPVNGTTSIDESGKETLQGELKNFTSDGKETLHGELKNLTGCGKKTLPNNIEDNIVDTIDDNIGIYAHTTAQGQNDKKRFMPPKTEEVQSYCKQRNSSVDPERFVDFYTSKGWRIGNQPMRDWKAALRTWERNERNTVPKERIGKNGIRMTAERSTDLDGVF